MAVQKAISMLASVCWAMRAIFRCPEMAVDMMLTFPGMETFWISTTQTRLVHQFEQLFKSNRGMFWQKPFHSLLWWELYIH